MAGQLVELHGGLLLFVIPLALSGVFVQVLLKKVRRRDERTSAGLGLDPRSHGVPVGPAV
jgi:hypothetical protein